MLKPRARGMLILHWRSIIAIFVAVSIGLALARDSGSYGSQLESYLEAVTAGRRPPRGTLCPEFAKSLQAISDIEFSEKVEREILALDVDRQSWARLRGSQAYALVGWTTRDGKSLTTQLPIVNLRICPQQHLLGSSFS